jgi:hypothetical protein
LRRTLRPLSESLERKKKNTDLKKSPSEHGSTSLDSPMPSSRVGCRIAVKVGCNNCTEGQFRGMFSIECLNELQIRLILSVTGFAFARGWFVEDHPLSIHFAGQFVTPVTRNPAMSAF